MAIFSDLGIQHSNVHVNLSSDALIQLSLETDKGSTLSDTGALIVYSGEKTGRSPKDKRIVLEESSKDNINWGDVNQPIDPASFNQAKQQAVAFFNTCADLFIVDGYAVWDKKNTIKVRIICTKAYHALFMYNMLIRPTQQELANFGTPDYILYNAGATSADMSIKGITSTTSIQLSFEQKEILIFGTEYAGEMKKAIFSLLNYLMPLNQMLSMHCSANEAANGAVSLFFGLSGTGKTTLSADPNRALIGDDEHGWAKGSVFNFEGGCYAKCIDLSAEKEPQIYKAIKPGALLENIVFNEGTNSVNFADGSITENTRVAYPIDHIDNAKTPSYGGNPKNIFFLTCDAFGILPPISKLTTEQAMYHFISGYTAKVAGTEVGITEPQTTFSACFGRVFLPLHPTKYADLLGKKLAEHPEVNVWLINTGWSGGAYGTGHRMSLKHTRSMITAALNGELNNVAYTAHDTFGVLIPQSCPNVPSELLNPRDTWADKAAYDEKAKHLAELFVKNFEKYAAQASPAILSAAPKI